MILMDCDEHLRRNLVSSPSAAPVGEAFPRGIHAFDCRRNMPPEVPPPSCIPTEEVAVLFRCGRCQTTPIKPPVYTCRSGHLNCVTCYNRFNRDCYKCKEPLLGRNQLLEEVVRSLPIQTCCALTDCSTPVRETKSEQSLQLMLQDPSHLQKLEAARLEAERQSRAREAAGDFSSSSSTCLSYYQPRVSHRPVYCPYPCGRVITLSGLFPHFEFHHPKVLITNVPTERPSQVLIHLNEVKGRDYRCHAFFVLHLDENDDADDNKWSAAALLKVTRSSQEMLKAGLFVSTLSVGRLANPLEGDERGSWFLAVWASSLYNFSPISYTLSASNEHCPNSVSFTGPLVSLHETQRPEDVYARGQCLLVPPGLQREMRFREGYELRLTITFHSDINFPFKLPDSLDISLLDKHLLDFTI